MVEKCGSAFESHLTSDLMQLVFTCLSHTNRFVRETGYRVIADIITIPGQYSTYYLHTHTHTQCMLEDLYDTIPIVMVHTCVHVHTCSDS